MACCLALQSGKEYRHWLFTYVRYLVQEGEILYYCLIIITVYYFTLLLPNSLHTTLYYHRNLYILLAAYYSYILSITKFNLFDIIPLSPCMSLLLKPAVSVVSIHETAHILQIFLFFRHRNEIARYL